MESWFAADLHLYELTATAATRAIRFTLEGTVMTQNPVTLQSGPALFIRGPNEPGLYYSIGRKGSSRVTMTAIVPPGTVQVGAGASTERVWGDYVLTADPGVEKASAGSSSQAALRPRSISRRASALNGLTVNYIYYTAYPGSQVTLTVTSDDFPPAIEHWRYLKENSMLGALDGDRLGTYSGNRSVTVVFRHGPLQDYVDYYFRIGSSDPARSGAYTLSLSISYP
jgi:hypothetical protein